MAFILCLCTQLQTHEMQYQYKDGAALAQTPFLYYRIMAQDVNDHKTYTQIIRIGSAASHSDLQLMGNLIHDQLVLRYYDTNAEQLVLTILDQQGRRLQTGTTPVHSGTNIIKHSLGKLPAGVYLVRVQSAGNTAKAGQTVRFLKR